MIAIEKEPLNTHYDSSRDSMVSLFKIIIINDVDNYLSCT